MDHQSPSQLFYARDSNYAGQRESVRRSSVRISTDDATSISERYENLLLRALPPHLLRDLDPYLTLVDLAKQQLLPRGTDRLNYVYFPITAVVSDYSLLADGRMVEIAVTGREGAVGLSSFLLDRRSGADITQVSQPGTAKRIDAGTLAALLGPNEGWQINLRRCMSLYIKQISQKAICNMYHSVEGRMCTWLLMVRDRCGLVTLRLTQEYLSQVLGVYRPTVTGIAQKLRRDNVIDYERGTIVICDRKKLEESACTCYSYPDWTPN